MEEVKDQQGVENIARKEDAGEEMGMGELLGQDVKVEEGKTIAARVVAQTDDGFLVDLGLKSEGLIPKSEIDTPAIKKEVVVGATVPVFVVALHGENGHPVVSYKKVRESAAFERLAENFQSGAMVKGAIVSKVKGGFIVDIGTNAFLPLSQLELRPPKDVDSYIGKSFEFTISEFNRQQKNIVVSRRKMLEEAQKENKLKTLSALAVGQSVEGVVTNITDFGVFVELEPGIEGLLHGTEISWSERNPKLKDLYKPGQEVELKIIGLDSDEERISLSLKKMGQNPWEDVAKQFPAGSKIKGVVSHLTPFGAFIKLSGGIEGLIHVSDMSWTKKVRHPQDVLKEGEEVECVVREINLKDEKIALSIKHLHEDPFKKFATGKVVSGTVKRIVDFGAFVEIEEGIEALVRLSEISFEKIAHPSEALKVGQSVEAKIIKSDLGDKKIDISIKKLDKDRERELLKKYVNKGEKPTLGDILEADEE